MKTHHLLITLIILSGCTTNSRFGNDLQYQSGPSLAAIKPISIEGFMERWMQNYTVKPGTFNSNITELSRDSAYTYFYRNTLKTPLYFKVLTAELNNTDYTTVDGAWIFAKFREEIIPAEDIALVKNITGKSFEESNRKYNWQYNKEKKEMNITCIWKEHWGFSKILDKKYTAVYSIDQKTFLK
ncbi:MAG: hypothetical protein JST86_15165 [Bacteroidetes bacterium]|nr:hypothetical protein [Bacteroidota bacterium]